MLYRIAVTHKTLGAMQVRVRNKGEYGSSATALCGPAYPGATRYAPDLEVLEVLEVATR